MVSLLTSWVNRSPSIAKCLYWRHFQLTSVNSVIAGYHRGWINVYSFYPFYLITSFIDICCVVTWSHFSNSSGYLSGVIVIQTVILDPNIWFACNWMNALLWFLQLLFFKYSEPVFHFWMSNIQDNGKRCCIYNVFSQWLWPCSPTYNKKNGPDISWASSETRW